MTDMTLSEADAGRVWEALMTAHSLIDDLRGLESAGLATGFKPDAVKRMQLENKRAFAAIAAQRPDLPSPH